jgi:DNA repair exonuclease SbcCD ATPase subunit
MLLDFITQGIEDFKSFVGHHVLDLDGEPGLVFVRGRNLVEKRLGANGAGKSSVADAITWTLYGRTAAGLRNPDIAAWKGGKTARCATTIKVDDVKHTIERTASPNRLRIDGKDAGQEAVDKLLRMDFDTFVQTVLFAQGQPLFLDMQPRDKMGLFSTVLDLDRWDRRAKGASEQVSRLEKVESEVQVDIAAAEAAQDEVTSTLKDLRDRSHDWEAERAQRGKTIDKSLVVAKKNLAIVDKKFAAADLIYDGAMTELKLLSKDLSDARLLFDSAQDELSEQTAVHLSLARDLEKHKREIDQLGESDVCPTCGQSLKGTDLAKHQAEARRLFKQLQKEADKASAMVDKKRKTATEHAARVSTLRKQCDALDDKAREAGNERDAVYPRVVEFQQTIKSLEAQQRQSQDEDNPYTEQIQKLRRKKGKLDVDLRDLDKELAKTRRTIERSRYWVKGFKEIRLFVVDEVLQEMEIACTVMLEEMGLIGWQMLFSTEKETKSGTIQRGIIVNIVSPSNDKSVRWECWSGGEGQRLRLVGALALAEVLLMHAGVDPNIEILDEPTRSLSQEGVRDMCEYLAERADQLGKRIYYTDHQAVESSHFAGTITIVKDSNGSRIEET